MKTNMTEYLAIDLESELWCCRKCEHELASARGNYKEGLLVYDRDPREIHKPIINPDLYEYTFAPDPEWCRILEYYCPNCATQIEVEYLPPGHPPMFDMEFDIDSLKERYLERKGQKA
ncbi:acetone carboxylase subunit gamma [Bacillus piscicola]|uniref:acetone carboxylase subunit gamma n=1 Tax=Bacillus piscicola TaxID=1632684 RepID=UPI001F08E85E|nr:acetone carboxylase subunit gamma [Bacillus piscicola]